MEKQQLRKLIRKQIESIIASPIQEEHKLTLQFVNEKTSEKQFLYSLNEEFNNEFNSILTENVFSKGIDAIKVFVEKILKWVFGIFKTIVNKIATIGTKAFSILKGIYNVIAKFQQKHPVLFKIIVIFIIVLILLVATASVAQANVAGSNPEQTNFIINSAIGLIDSLDAAKHSTYDIMEAKAYLLSLRDKMEGTYEFSKNAKVMGDSAIKIINGNIEEYRTANDERKNILAEILTNYGEVGKNMILISIEKIKGISGTGFSDMSNIKIGLMK